jgi:arsenite methyltransferase
MAGLAFSSDVAKTLVAAYRTPDMVRQRAATLQRLHLIAGERVIDIGCGPGFLCKSMAAAVGPTGSVIGIDISEDLIDFATNQKGSFTDSLPSGRCLHRPAFKGRLKSRKLIILLGRRRIDLVESP